MRRYRQKLPEIVAALTPIKSTWKDEHAESVIEMVNIIPEKNSYDSNDITALFDTDFNTAFTLVRLFLEMSKDEFSLRLREKLGDGGIGIKRYKQSPSEYTNALISLHILEAMDNAINKKVTWRDILEERLKSGRGSAIRGQKRGRFLEDATEEIVNKVFVESGFDVRCRFKGARRTSTEKADFAIPSMEDPRILIEVKAYGATGSKQTDILGDLSRIVQEKRHDTDLILVTDGITWKSRLNDLRKLVEMQNTGFITRIYTYSMLDHLEQDLYQLKQDHFS